MKNIRLCENGEQIQKMTLKKGLILSVCVAIAVVIVGLILNAAISSLINSNSSECVTYKNYSMIKEDMNYSEVVEIMGGNEGEYHEEPMLFGYIDEYYLWTSQDGTKSIKVRVRDDNTVSSVTENNLSSDHSVDSIISFYLISGCALISMSVTLCIVSNKMKKERKELNDRAIKEFKSEGINTYRKLCITEISNANSHEACKLIVVDEDKHQIGWVDYKSENVIITSFDEILNYEVYENGGVVTNGAGITGGRLFGKRTILSTSSFKTTSHETSNELRLIVRLNSIGNSQIVYSLVEDRPLNIGLSKNSKIYKQLIVSLQEVVSFLEAVMAENKKCSEVVVTNLK